MDLSVGRRVLVQTHPPTVPVPPTRPSDEKCPSEESESSSLFFFSAFVFASVDVTVKGTRRSRTSGPSDWLQPGVVIGLIMQLPVSISFGSFFEMIEIVLQLIDAPLFFYILHCMNTAITGAATYLPFLLCAAQFPVDLPCHLTSASCTFFCELFGLLWLAASCKLARQQVTILQVYATLHITIILTRVHEHDNQ